MFVRNCFEFLIWQNRHIYFGSSHRELSLALLFGWAFFHTLQYRCFLFIQALHFLLTLFLDDQDLFLHKCSNWLLPVYTKAFDIGVTPASLLSFLIRCNSVPVDHHGFLFCPKYFITNNNSLVLLSIAYTFQYYFCFLSELARTHQNFYQVCCKFLLGVFDPTAEVQLRKLPSISRLLRVLEGV